MSHEISKQNGTTDTNSEGLLDISGTLKFCRTLQAHYMTTSSKNMRQQELLQTASQSFFCSFKQQPLQPPHALQVMKSSVVITRTMLFGLLAAVSHCLENEPTGFDLVMRMLHQVKLTTPFRAKV
jgi:hypothetical protein